MKTVDWLSLITTLEPLAVPLINDISALVKKRPDLTPEQLTALISELAQAVHTINAETLALITADQQAHPAA